ncbi:protein disulfide-isomerase-like protein of the testis [Cygnus atratus]|uniref:protein disulfide-isomerase-like protein of the testis n=1 Tax=Cygnus atratus TaxID=8868 RepID=UPI0021B76D30|nr:protein disulfide-isomerase-like protein of the testis [Cygnus atratus]
MAGIQSKDNDELCQKYVFLSQASQNLSEEFAEAARQLKKEAPRIQFGKIDVTDQHDLRKEFNIREFPTVKFFVDGSREDPIDCKGKLSHALILKAELLLEVQIHENEVSDYIYRVDLKTSFELVNLLVRSQTGLSLYYMGQRRTGPSTVLINSTDQAEAMINADNLAVIGFFKELCNNSMEVFCETAKDVPEMPFGMTSREDVCANYGIQKNTLVVFKKTSVKIFDVPVENHILLFIPTNSKTFNVTYENYKSAAMEFRGKITFVLVNTNETRNGRVFEYFRIRDVDVPTVRILNLKSNAKYKMPADEVTVENLRHFCQSYLDGKAKLHLSSEEITEDWDKMPVKVLVGKNFNRIVFNKTMTVFVMFYAPWSHDCRKLLPIWDELGEKYQNRNDIIIAKIDVTANDILSVVLDRYPFFRLFPAGADYQEMAYAGEHTLEAFSEFLEEQIKTKAETGEKDPSGGIKENLSQKETVITEKEEL